MSERGPQVGDGPGRTLAEAQSRRASDAAFAEHTAFAIEDLTHLIAEAVKLSDDRLVARLDRVLRRVEDIVELSRGSPRDHIA